MKEYNEALTNFKNALDNEPLSADINFNLGIVEFNLGHFGSSLAYWRRALDLSPWHSSAKDAIAYLDSLNKLKKLPEDGSLRHKLHASILRFLPFPILMVVTLILFTLSVWVLMSFLGARRRATMENNIPPSLPTMAPILFCFWILFCVFSLAKLTDKKTIRATIVTANTSLRTSPTEESASIIEMFEGQEVIVVKQEPGWLQVNYLGKTTGWILLSSAILSSGDFL